MTDQDASTSPNIRYSHWQKEYEDALGEGDPQSLRHRVDAAEKAIFLRSQELSGNPLAEAERQAIAKAIRTLRAIQRDKLGYPDWNKK
jgi:hypothetical protein